MNDNNYQTPNELNLKIFHILFSFYFDERLVIIAEPLEVTCCRVGTKWLLLLLFWANYN